jgi:GDP-4-dehydro-6-deoxy-D-mannose reductase
MVNPTSPQQSPDARSSGRRRLLVTGHSGFVGRHVRALAPLAAGFDVRIPTQDYDLLDPASLAAAIDEVQPDAVLHLAGLTFVPDAIRDPERAIQVNVVGTLRLLQTLKQGGFRGPMVYVSSGDVYGLIRAEQLPITELTPVQPRNPYAVSKVSAELLCQQWALTENWSISIARPFNHIGAGQGSQFVVAKIASLVARIKAGLAAPQLSLGDIDVSRDFLDVSDVVAAYFALLERGAAGEIYNICSGRERTIRELVERMLMLAGVKADIVVDNALLRPSEQRRVVGSNKKILQATGWSPSVDLDKTLQSVLLDWEERIKHE